MEQSGRLEDLFEDLEQQAAGLELAERDAELLDRTRGEYAVVTLADRVHASVGRVVELTLRSGQRVSGTITSAGVDWCSVGSPDGRDVRLVRIAAVAAARGLSARSLPEPARPVVARLGFGSALHRFAEASPEVVVRLASGPAVHASLRRVGADFVEVEAAEPGDPGPTLLLAFSAIEAVGTLGTLGV